MIASEQPAHHLEKNSASSKFHELNDFNTQVDITLPLPGMDCNTCDTAPAVVLNKPEVVNVTLTITTKAKEMLDSAFDGDMSNALLVGVLSGVVPDTCMIYKL